jgi:hypothetical protein
MATKRPGVVDQLAGTIPDGTPGELVDCIGGSGVLGVAPAALAA